MKNITSPEEFQSEVLDSKKPVLLDFWAAWCGPCKMIKPVIEATATELEGIADVVLVNSDDQQKLAVEYGIKALPTFLIFKNGKLQETIVGANVTQKGLVAKLKQYAE